MNHSVLWRPPTAPLLIADREERVREARTPSDSQKSLILMSDADVVSRSDFNCLMIPSQLLSAGFLATIGVLIRSELPI